MEASLASLTSQERGQIWTLAWTWASDVARTCEAGEASHDLQGRAEVD